MNASKGERGIWRTEVQVRIREIRHRLEVARKLDLSRRPLGQPDEEREAIAAGIEDCLDVACRATEEATGLKGRLSAWWTGSAMTTGWESVHEAELNLVRIEGEEEIRASLPRLRAWMESTMGAGKRRSRYKKTLEAQAKGEVPLDRLLIQQVLTDVTVANDERYANLRAFRNTLVMVTVMLATLVFALAVWHLFDTGFLTLCSNGAQEADCLDGSTPQRTDVGLVALIGAVGGLLAIAFGLSETETAPSRFDPKAWQALLKPVAGAATGLGGVLLIQADILLGPSDSRSEALLLSYALLFGFSQQLFTRFVDKRAGELIGVEEDGKEHADPVNEPPSPELPPAGGPSPQKPDAQPAVVPEPENEPAPENEPEPDAEKEPEPDEEDEQEPRQPPQPPPSDP